MNKVYYLPGCSTCRRILKEINPDISFELIDIKSNPLTEEQLEELKNLAGNYSNIFNKQARKYRELSLHKEDLSEDDIKNLILNEYTFLKRPVFIVDNRIYVGNSRKTVNELSGYMNIRSKRAKAHKSIY